MAAKKRKEAMEKEIELVKLEYEEKLKKRKKSKAEKAKKDEKADKKTDDEEDDKKADKVSEKEKSDKINAITSKNAVAETSTDLPRIYSLQKIFFQKRLERIKTMEAAKRNRERLSNPSLFPSVPRGVP